MNRPLSRRELAELCECSPQDLPQAPAFQMGAFDPPGPICAAYIRSIGPMDAIMGPGGSGKSVGSVFKLIRFSIGAMPICLDGVIRVRGTVIRENFRTLYRTTLRTWFEWFPPDFHGAIFTGGQDRPAQHILKLSTVRLVNGVRREVPVELTVDFFAVEESTYEEIFKGYETSWVWCNEADGLSVAAISKAFTRTGRYPKLERLAPGTRRPRLLAMDFNPPAPKHPLLVACERGSFQEDPERDEDGNVIRTINFFKQPSGLSPNAENRRGKSLEAYQEEARTSTEEDVRRFVLGLPGYPSDGKPIYRNEFRRAKHVAVGKVEILRGLPLHAGFDQGLTPAVIFFQEDTYGQLRILREVVPGHGFGFQRFIERVLPVLHGDLAGLQFGSWTGDPAGFTGADTEGGETAWAQSVSIGLGHVILPAPTNEPMLRWEAVRLPLRIDISADKPGLIIDESCSMLIEGFEAEYKHPKRTNGTFGDEAAKNLHSNPHDALQYGILGLRGAEATVRQAGRAGRPGGMAPGGECVIVNSSFSGFG